MAQGWLILPKPALLPQFTSIISRAMTVETVYEENGKGVGSQDNIKMLCCKMIVTRNVDGKKYDNNSTCENNNNNEQQTVFTVQCQQ